MFHWQFLSMSTNSRAAGITLPGIAVALLISSGLVPSTSAESTADLTWTVVSARTLTGAFMGAVLIPIAALVFCVVSTYRHERTRLLKVQVKVERVVFQNNGITDTLRGALIESVRTDIENIQTSVQARELSHEFGSTRNPKAPNKSRGGA